jgi:hypothetical protein
MQEASHREAFLVYGTWIFTDGHGNSSNIHFSLQKLKALSPKVSNAIG